MKTKDMIRSIDENMDDLISSCELVSSGIFRDKSALVSLRVRRKKRIPFFKFGNSYRYLKRDVIDFINANANPDDEYTGTFFLYKDESSTKDDSSRSERVKGKVKILFEEFEAMSQKHNKEGDTDGDEWIEAVINYAANLLLNSVSILYLPEKREEAFKKIYTKLVGIID